MVPSVAAGGENAKKIGEPRIKSIAGEVRAVQVPEQHHHHHHSPEKDGEKPDLPLMRCWPSLPA
jgi:hypothetical protein